ncbi:MAG: ATP-binding protein [Desulfuromonadales bacterium]
MKWFGLLSKSLISKFTFRTGLVLLVTISLFAYINVSALKEVFLQDAKDDVETVSEIILHTTHFQMLEDNRQRVYEMIQEVCQHDKIDRIRLYSPAGHVHFSTQEKEIGKSREAISTIFGGTLMLLIIIALSWMTQSMVIDPVHDLLLHARKVANMELDSQLQLKSNDEIGELSDAFNSMTVKLKDARDEYQKLNETLEAKVIERTEEIAQVNDQLVRSEKLASLGQLVAGIAHEINNPLAGILMFANMFADDDRLDQEQRDDALTIVHETKRCADIVKRLLDFSRTSIPDKQVRSLSEIMESTLALVEHHAEVNDVEIIRKYDDDLPDMEVDPNQMEQVFINLLVNACHAMPLGGRLTISMRTNRARDRVITTIEDTGQGITEENLGRIFDPFFTTKNQDLNGISGTGLGLSVSYGIIQNHGGQIKVQSAVGRGTLFTIDLPVDWWCRGYDILS